jgi:hypothetical protein
MKTKRMKTDQITTTNRRGTTTDQQITLTPVPGGFVLTAVTVRSKFLTTAQVRADLDDDEAKARVRQLRRKTRRA